MAFLQAFPDMERATFGARGPTMGLPSMKSLLNRMGDPHKGTPTIHVAGSKGKGSTSTYIASILKAGGQQVALYTSPHLHDYTERIAFNSDSISDERFATGVAEIKDSVEAERDSGNSTISTFGILTALFFHLVKSAPTPVQWQIVEVGLGGRYDVTNVFESKAAAVITPISLEHAEILGSTQTEIAANKAGIVVPHCLTVLAPQKDAGARTAVGRRCHEVDSELIDVGKKYKIKPISQDLEGQTFSMEGLGANLELRIKMLGAHQINNAATAVATILGLRERGELEISDEAIIEGLSSACIRGRLEILSQAASGPIIVADGAHNHESAAALAQAIKNVFDKKNCIFIVGVNTDKNISAIWKELAAMSKLVITTKSTNPRSMEPSQIAELLNVFEIDRPEVSVTQSVSEAIDKALAVAAADDLICITGSLYVVAEAREHVLDMQKAKKSAATFY
ncbi:folylpolyglutamate synthase/dihydrofolate synthase family protein [soil metagenome]